MKLLLRFDDYLVKAEKALVVVLIAAMVGLSFLQVVLRLLFNSGIVWMDPLLRHMVLWSGFTGAAIASRYSTHFALEAFVKSAPRALHRPLEIFASAFTTAKFIRDEFAYGSVAFYIHSFPVPGGWAEIIIPVAFALIAFHSLMVIFRPKDSTGERT